MERSESFVQIAASSRNLTVTGHQLLLIGTTVIRFPRLPTHGADGRSTAAAVVNRQTTEKFKEPAATSLRCVDQLGEVRVGPPP